jgi:hypothetical protein
MGMRLEVTLGELLLIWWPSGNKSMK